MMQGVLDRFLFSVLVAGTFAAAGGILFAVVRQWMGARLRRDRSAQGVTSSNPVLLYFWSAGCSQCKPQEAQIEQARAVLEGRGTSLQVRKIDAVQEKGLAKSMRVMTLPTTILIDQHGKVIAWNPGLTPSRSIVDQYQRLAGVHGDSARPPGPHRDSEEDAVVLRM